jgi:hypothetical protein
MATRYIDFISAYCDSWCERCAFTERCSHFAVRSALGMCDGNYDAAVELAIGPPRLPGKAAQKSLRERMAEAIGDGEPSQSELEAIKRELLERQERARRFPIAEKSRDYAVAADRWLQDHARRADHTDPAIRDAIEAVGWDLHLIPVKIIRALQGRDEHGGGAAVVKRAVQSDWNGSAKVALLSLERSERAWRALAEATADESAAALARSLQALRADVVREFPDAMTFQRPGFDTSGRPSR